MDAQKETAVEAFVRCVATITKQAPCAYMRRRVCARIEERADMRLIGDAKIRGGAWGAFMSSKYSSLLGI